MPIEGEKKNIKPKEFIKEMTDSITELPISEIKNLIDIACNTTQGFAAKLEARTELFRQAQMEKQINETEQ